jgi:Glyoxalase-like domain
MFPTPAVPRIRQELRSAATRLANALSRFEGVHILVFEAADVDAATQMLSASGVVCGAVNRIRRPVRRARGTAEVSIGYAEIENDQRSPEGRLAVAEPLPDVEGPTHPNGAIELLEVLLCVPSDQLPQHVERYQRYLRQSGRAEITATCFSCRGTRCALSAIAMSPRCFRESNPSAHTKSGMSTSCQPSSATRCPCETSPPPASY